MSEYIRYLKGVKDRLKGSLGLKDEVIGLYDLDDIEGVEEDKDGLDEQNESSND